MVGRGREEKVGVWLVTTHDLRGGRLSVCVMGERREFNRT